MRAVTIRAYGGPEVLEVTDVPEPVPGPAQVRIRVAAAAVNPVDVQTRTGALTRAGIMLDREVVGLGWDVSGVVDAVGPSVEDFAPGDRVIGLSDLPGLAAKAQADFVVLDAAATARLPEDTDLVAAATLPLNALTAAQSLDLLPRRPETLLVTGAAGAVGGYTVELAARAGARVIAVARAGDESLVRSLGAAEVVPPSDDLAAAVRALAPGGVDAAVDVASLGIRALDAVRGAGAFVSVLSGAAPPPLRGIRVANVWIRADGPRLATLAASGLTLRVAATLPLTDVADAHRTLESGGLRGRLVLVP
ncbi:NADP-dependent oxidoreductase [Dactylosporangium sp. NPDC051485]|uniref:NADP-dependent oxidoreductase n=1 Tax=Dactylosporangium sp. NPDC051485 TaxID=3154846 RepID=UPI0034312A0A